MTRHAWLLTVLIGVNAVHADVLQLKDGQRLEGDVKRQSDGWVVIDSTGRMAVVKADDVRSIQMTPATNPSAAAERLTTLRRSTETMSDPKLAIDRYGRFIETAGDEAAIKSAKEDLAVWQQRLDQGMTRVGNQWVSSAERAQMQEKSLVLAYQARDLMRQGRLKDAEPVLQQAIAADPGSASAHYLRGVLAYRQDQFPAARKAFDATAALIADHAPTLNNLAVVMHRQNQIPGALAQFDRAMVVAPAERFILSNVAELLETLDNTQRSSDVAKRVQKRYDEQIAQLDARLAHEGLYRWGAAWVTAADLEKLKAVEAEHKGKLDQMAVDFDKLQSDVNRIDLDITDLQREMKQDEAETIRYDQTGRLVRTALPGSYYRKADQVRRLTAQRADVIAQMERLRVAARNVQRQLPTPRFTGTIQLIGEQGTPVAEIQPAKPTTAPTTQP